MNKFVLILVLFICSVDLSAQESHVMDAQEKQLMKQYLLNQSKQIGAVSTPPVSPVRTIGEWEELQGLMIGWKTYQPILREIVRAAKLETKVIVVYGSPDTETSITNYLSQWNIDTVNVKFLGLGLNSVWCRDYGPWSAYTNDVDSLITVDWIYNRPRPLDDIVPSGVSNYLNTPFYQTNLAPWNLIHTGGNFMTDGMGTGFSSKLITDENPSLTVAAIDSIMYRFMGINRYIKMDKLPYDVIHHIDMHIKLLDEETLLVGQYPTGIADGPQIEANIQYILNNYMSPFGTPYKIVRIPMPADNGLYPNNGGDYYTYTNSSFINKTIIVPTYGISTDSLAINLYRQYLPGYNVVGINSSASISALGALHCITKELGTNDPLYIVHQPLKNSSDTINGYSVGTTIKHRTGIGSATLYYRTDTTLAFIPISMTLSAISDSFTCIIPAQQSGTKINYYIEAVAISGKTQVRPIVAPNGYWTFEINTSVGAEELIASNKSEIGAMYPNPVTRIACIPVNLSRKEEIKMTVEDINGRTIQIIADKTELAGEHKYFIDGQKFEDGIYIIKLQESNGAVHTQKFVVAK